MKPAPPRSKVTYVLKNNEARPVRRTLDWYMRVGDPRHIETLHRGRQALKQGER
jgi:hypothetical protein